MFDAVIPDDQILWSMNSIQYNNIFSLACCRRMEQSRGLPGQASRTAGGPRTEMWESLLQNRICAYVKGERNREARM